MSKLYRLRYMFWLTLPLVGIWFWRRITQTDIAATLSSFRLDLYLLVALIGFNAVIMFFFNGRWWLILRAQGFRVPYLDTFRYRMAAFAINYFTPGGQFGGEPLQIYALHTRNKLPASRALASVTLDKLFELVSSMSFLGIGAVLLLRNELHLGISGKTLAYLAAGLILLPAGYLALLWSNHKPVSRMLDGINHRLPEALHARPLLKTALDIAGRAERQMAELIHGKPGLIFQMLASSLLIWASSLAEYWLALRVLNVHLTLGQTILALTAARLAFLTPLPGGLGALEAGQMLAMRTLGLSPLTGIAISLWIRSRDIALGAIGAACGSVLAGPDIVETLSTSAGD